MATAAPSWWQPSVPVPVCSFTPPPVLSFYVFPCLLCLACWGGGGVPATLVPVLGPLPYPSAMAPVADNYGETLSTLRYADTAKKIRTHAVVNEDANAKLIRELREEVERLRGMIDGTAYVARVPYRGRIAVESWCPMRVASVCSHHEFSFNRTCLVPLRGLCRVPGAAKVSDAELLALRERLQESEKLMQSLTMSWEEKLRIAHQLMEERQRQLQDMGISVEKGGLAMDESKRYLLNLTPVRGTGELSVYYLQESITRVGSNRDQDISISGEGVIGEHCCLHVKEGDL